MRALPNNQDNAKTPVVRIDNSHSFRMPPASRAYAGSAPDSVITTVADNRLVAAGKLVAEHLPSRLSYQFAACCKFELVAASFFSQRYSRGLQWVGDLGGRPCRHLWSAASRRCWPPRRFGLTKAILCTPSGLLRHYDLFTEWIIVPQVESRHYV